MALTTRVIQGGTTSMTQPYHINGQRGYNYDHEGVDLTGFNGSYNVLAWITAHTAGTVVDIRTNCTGFEYGSYGNYVLLRHDNGMYTMYAHLAYGYVSVSYGQRVNKGQVLGYMDNTGTSYGGHLHFEIRRANGQKIDPEPYLNAELPGSGSNNGGGSSNPNVVFTYQVWDDVQKKWLPNVQNTADYAGLLGHDVDAVYVSCDKGNVTYAVHMWKGDASEAYPDSRWLPEVKNRTDYAGKAHRPIDAFILKSDKPAAYRVHLRKQNIWLPWVKTANANYNDKENGYAGMIGSPIDAIQIKSL